MSTTTPNLGLVKPASSDRFWGATLNDNLDLIDDGLVLRTGSTFNDAAAAAVFHTGTVRGSQLGGASSELLGFWGASPAAQPANTVELVALLSAVGLRASGGNPALNIGTGALTCGAANLGGAVAIADGQNVAVGSTVGTMLATTATQKLGFWGASPAAQPSGAAQAALIDNTAGDVSVFTLDLPGVPSALTDGSGGSASSAIATATNTSALTDGSGGSASTALAAIADASTANAVASLASQLAAQRALNTVLINAVASLAAKVNGNISALAKERDNSSRLAKLQAALRAAMVGAGLMKGSA